MSVKMTIRRVLAGMVVGLMGVALSPAVLAQQEEPGATPSGATEDECVTRFVGVDPQTEQPIFAEDCPNQTGSSTGGQTFTFVDNLNTRISQQRQTLRSVRGNGNGGGSQGGGASADGEGDGVRGYGRLSPFGILDYAESDRNATSSGKAYDQDTESAILGFDYRIDSSLFAGATLSYLSGDTKFVDDSGSVGTDGYVFGIHGSKYWDNGLFVDTLINYGELDADIARVDPNGNYDAATDGSFYSAEAALGREYSNNRWRFTPRARLLYLSGSLDSYSENGPDTGVRQNVEKQRFDSTNLELSFQADYIVLTGWGVLVPSVNVGYRREYSDANIVEGERLYPFGGPSEPFSQKTDSPDRTTVVIRAGVSAQFARGWSGFASYERLFEHRYLDHDNVVVGIRYEIF